MTTPDQAPPREPTEEMVIAGRKASPFTPAVMWRAMYDAWANSSTPATPRLECEAVDGRDSSGRKRAGSAGTDAALIARLYRYADPTCSRYDLLDDAQLAADRLAAQAARIAKLEIDCTIEFNRAEANAKDAERWRVFRNHIATVFPLTSEMLDTAADNSIADAAVAASGKEQA